MPPLETLTDSGDEDIAIGTILLPEVERCDGPFDPRRRLTKEVWKKLINNVPLNGDLNPSALIDRAQYLSSLRILDPSYHFPFDNYSGAALYRVPQVLMDLRAREHVKLAKVLVPCALLFPSQRKEWTTFLRWNTSLKLKMQQLRDHLQWAESAEYLTVTIAYKMLFPETEGIVPLHVHFLEWFHHQLEDLEEKGWWRHIAEHKALMRLAYPEETENCTLSKAEWDEMKRKFEETLLDLSDVGGLIDCKNVLYMAKDLLILSADNVRITDCGLELTMPEREFDLSLPPFPTLRSF